MDCFAAFYKSALQIWLFWRDFSKSQTHTAAILLSYPDTILHGQNYFDNKQNTICIINFFEILKLPFCAYPKVQIGHCTNRDNSLQDL